MAPVASVAVRKVSAKNFFMDCSFHDCSAIRRNLSDSGHFIFAPMPSSRLAIFFMDANTKMGTGAIFELTNSNHSILVPMPFYG
jgi:hypothetical protein